MAGRRIIFTLFASLLFSWFFSGCTFTEKPADDKNKSVLQDTGNNSADKELAAKKEKVILNFSWWGEKERHDGTLAAINLWNENNPDIQVEPYFSGWEGYHDKLDTQFAGKNAPDIFQFSIARLQEYASKDLLLDFTPYKEPYFADIDEDLWGDLMFNGRIYGAPSSLNGIAMAYNKTKLEQLGVPTPLDDETWLSLMEKAKMATKDTNGDGKVDFWGLQDPIDQPIDNIIIYLKQNGLELWSDDLRSSNLDDPRVIEAFKGLGEFRDAGTTPDPDAVTLQDGQGYMAGGYVAFSFIALSSFSGEQANTNDELDLVLFPGVNGKKRTDSLITGLPLGVYNKSKHSEEAIQFLSWLLTDGEAARVMGMVRGIFPSKIQRDATANNLTNEEQKVFRVANKISALNNIHYDKFPKNLGEWDRIYAAERDKYSFYAVTLEEFLQNVKQNADPVLADE